MKGWTRDPEINSLATNPGKLWISERSPVRNILAPVERALSGNPAIQRGKHKSILGVEGRAWGLFGVIPSALQTRQSSPAYTGMCLTQKSSLPPFSLGAHTRCFPLGQLERPIPPLLPCKFQKQNKGLFSQLPWEGKRGGRGGWGEEWELAIEALTIFNAGSRMLWL